MFRFADSQALYLLVLVPLFALMYWGVCFWKKRQMIKLGNPELLKQLTQGYSKYRPLVKFVLIEVILTLMILQKAFLRSWQLSLCPLPIQFLKVSLWV